MNLHKTEDTEPTGSFTFPIILLIKLQCEFHLFDMKMFF